MRLLVIGANSLLGSNIIHFGQQRGWDICGTYHSTTPQLNVPLSQFDLRNYDNFATLLDVHSPEVVANCAAITDVDSCEKYPESARLINGEAPGQLAAQCEERGVEFVHVSTDYVFDGSEHKQYCEEDSPNPIQVYGKSKLLGERAIREGTDNALIPRLSFVWGLHRNQDKLTGFPAWVENKLRNRQELPLFVDQWITPTRAGQAAETILTLIEHNKSGLYHIASTSCVSPYEFGRIIANAEGVGPELLQKGSMEERERDAKRPEHTCLDVSALEETLDRPQPTLRDDVETVWNQLD